MKKILIMSSLVVGLILAMIFLLPNYNKEIEADISKSKNNINATIEVRSKSLVVKNLNDWEWKTPEFTIITANGMYSYWRSSNAVDGIFPNDEIDIPMSYFYDARKRKEYNYLEDPFESLKITCKNQNNFTSSTFALGALPEDLDSKIYGAIRDYKEKPSKIEKKAKQDLLATIKPYEGYAIEITNDNSSKWNKITFTINEKYSYTADSLDPGDTFVFELSRFTKADGERFNYITHAIKMFSIKCTIDDYLCFDIWNPTN